MRVEGKMGTKARLVGTFSLVVAGLPMAAAAQERLQLVAIEPCRLLDTRTLAAPAGGVLLAGVIRAVQADGDPCDIPTDAKGLQGNLTATNTEGPGFLAVLRPTGHIPANPVASTSVLNFTGPGQTVANAAFVPLGSRSGHSWDGSFWLLAGGAGCDVVVDVTGYYVLAP